MTRGIAASPRGALRPSRRVDQPRTRLLRGARAERAPAAGRGRARGHHLPVALRRRGDRARSPSVNGRSPREDDPPTRSTSCLARQLVRRARAGRPILGTVESVDAITRGPVANFASCYRADELVIAASGGLDPGEFRDPRREALRRARAPWSCAIPRRCRIRSRSCTRTETSSSSTSRSARRRRRTPIRALRAARAQHAARRTHEFAALPCIREEAACVLGRLGPSFLSDTGPLSIQMGVAPEQARSAAAAAARSSRGARRRGAVGVRGRGPPDNLKGGVIIGMESVSNRMEHMARQELSHRALLAARGARPQRCSPSRSPTLRLAAGVRAA